MQININKIPSVLIIKFFNVLFIALLSLFGIHAYAQTVPEARVMDSSGVNLLTGHVESSVLLVSIGSMSHSVSKFGQNSFYSSSQGYIAPPAQSGSDYNYHVVFGGRHYRFIANTGNPSGSTVFSEFNPKGNVLTYSGSGNFTFSGTSGSTASFAYISGGISGYSYLTELMGASGVTRYYSYNSGSLVSVHDNLGYQLKYQGNEIIAINNYDEYCNPTASTCSVSSSWARGSYTQPTSNVRKYTDAEGRMTELTAEFHPGTTILGHKNPMGGIHNAVYIADVLSTATRNGVANTYTISEDDKSTTTPDDDERTTIVTYPLGGTRTVVSLLKGNLLVSDTRAFGSVTQVTTYTYNSDKKIQSVTYPRGNSIHYSYDSRGNVTEVRRKSVTGSGSRPDIVTTAGYESSCTTANRKYCNKPKWTKDAREKQTNYTYYSAHGGVNTVTGPAPGAGASATKVTYVYGTYQAKVKNSSGSLINAAPVTKLYTVSTCRTALMCSGSANESVVVYEYDVNRNLTPSKVTRKSGNGAIESEVDYSYNEFGNLFSTNGSLAGDYDTSFTRYNKMRAPIGTVGPDPDGAGSLKRSAQRLTLNDLGQATLSESGTVTGVSDANWNAFVPAQAVHTEYSIFGRTQKKYSKTGSTTHAVKQYKYDARGRLECAATRMNANVFNSLPTSACSLGTTGAFGPDRIVKKVYDLGNRTTQTITGYGTSDTITQSASYYSYGPAEYVYDGNNNQTRYVYDNFNRPSYVYYPKTAGSGYNANDYERYDYDIYGRNYQTRQRDGQVVSQSYDDLGRTISTNAPGTSEDTSFTYDNVGNVLSVSKTGQTLNYAYDALGRLLSEASSVGTVSYEYNDQGQRTRMNYPGSGNFYVTYDYFNNGAMKSIREKGATSGVGVLATYAYDNSGRRTSVTRGNGNVTSYSFDTVSRLTSLDNDLAGSNKDQTLSFSYGPSGQVATQTNSNSIYDPTAINVGRTFTANGLNQIFEQNGTTFTYDSAGNMQTGNGKAFGYDYANRLTSVSGGSSGNGTLSYDPIGRLHIVTGSVSTKFLYDGSDMIAEYNSSNTVLRRYVHGPGVDEPLAEYVGTGTSNKTWLIADVRGTITARTNSSGTSVDTNTYDEFGAPGFGNAGRFQYTGQMWLAEVNLYYYKARMYDPTTKRFLQTDPIGYGGGMNMYAYVGGDPINLSDPSGLSCVYGPARSGQGGEDENGTYVYGRRGGSHCNHNTDPNLQGLDPANGHGPGYDPTQGTAPKGADNAGNCPITGEFKKHRAKITKIRNTNPGWMGLAIRPDGLIGRGMKDPFKDRVGWLDMEFSGTLGVNVQCTLCDGTTTNMSFDVTLSNVPHSIEITEASMMMSLHPRGAWIKATNTGMLYFGKRREIAKAVELGARAYLNSPDAICQGSEYVK